MNFPFGLGVLLHDFAQIWDEGRRFGHLEKSEGFLGSSSNLGFARIKNQGICEDEKLYILQGRR